MEHTDQAAQPTSPRVNVDQASISPPEQCRSSDAALVRHPASHRYEIAYLLSLRSHPASQKPPEGSSQLNSAMRWANTNRRSESGFKPPVRSGRFGSDELQQGNPQPLLTYQSEAGQGSLLGMPAHLRPNVGSNQKNLLKPNIQHVPPASGGCEGSQMSLEQPGGEDESEGRFRGMPRMQAPPQPHEAIFGPDTTNFLPQASKFVDDDLKQIGKSQLGLHPAGFQWGQPDRQGPTLGAAPVRPPPSVAVNAAGGAFQGYVPPPRMMDVGHRSGFDRVQGPGMMGLDNQYYTSGGPDNQWDHDPWDSPVNQGEVNDIFTLGDIRQAEHTIETQGISAESYANFRTRKILNDQADRRRPPNGPPAQDASAFSTAGKGMSPDIFFGDGRPPAMGGDRAPPGESRFLSMFNENAQTAAHDQRAPTPRALNATREQLQNQAISVLQNLPYHQQQQLAANWMAQQAENKSAGEKAQMREHLLKLLGLSKQHTQQAEMGQQGEQVFKQYQASAPAARPPGMTFSKPLNPAAPNFAPSGLYNPAVNNEHLKRGNGANMPAPPMDYRRGGQMGYEHSPTHHMGSGQSPHYPPGWNQRAHPHSPPLDEYGNVSPFGGAGYPTVQQMGSHPQGPPAGPPPPQPNADIQDLIQKILARHKVSNQHQVPDQQLAATQALHRSLSAAGNLTQEQVQQVLNYLRTSKQFTMNQATANQNARRNAAMHQQKAENMGMMGQQGRQQPNYPTAPPGVGPQAPVQPQLSQSALTQLLTAQNLLQQVNASPHGGRGARIESQKAMAALLQTLTKCTQPRPGGPPGVANPPNMPPASKHIQLSNCLEQLQNNQMVQNAMKKQAAAANQPQQGRGNYAPGGNSNTAARAGRGQPIGGFGMEHETGVPMPQAAPTGPPITKAEQHIALANSLRSIPPSHPLYNHIQQLLRHQRDPQERHAEQSRAAEAFVRGHIQQAAEGPSAGLTSALQSTTASSNNGAPTAPPTTTTSTTGPHTSNSCENKENGGGSEGATTENCSSPPTTAAPPAKEEVVGVEQNDHVSPSQIPATEE